MDEMTEKQESATRVIEAIETITADLEFWEPTPLLRWKVFNVREILQQQWKSNLGNYEWRYVPTE